MDLKISISADATAGLKEKADAEGVDIETYVMTRIDGGMGWNRAKGELPAYDPDQLFAAYIVVVQFQRHVWDALLEVFLKHRCGAMLSVTWESVVMKHIAPHLFGILENSCVLAAFSGIALLLDKTESNSDRSKKANMVLR